MTSFSSRKLFTFLIVPLLIIMMGCGGKSGGTVVVVPDFDSGLVTDGNFESGSDKWTGVAVNFQPEPGNEDNTINIADVAVAGQSFDVNMQQVFTD